MIPRYRTRTPLFQSVSSKFQTCSRVSGRTKNFRWLGIFSIAIAFVLGPVVAYAQQPKVARVGYLSNLSRDYEAARIESLRQGLRELGYIEGKNIIIEDRYAEGKLDRLAGFAAEFVHLKVDVIVTGGGTPTRNAQRATKTIPIVMTNVNDPVALGFVASLARPGANITGLSNLLFDLSGKRLELLKEVVPKVSRVAVLWTPATPGAEIAWKETEIAARELRVELQSLEVTKPEDFDHLFRAVAERRTGALMNLGGPLTNRYRKTIVEFAATSRLPAIYHRRDYVDEGGLMSYDASQSNRNHRAATYIDKILRGAKPADLPVEQPTKFELVINLKTAKQIGLTIPPNVLARADRVIK